MRTKSDVEQIGKVLVGAPHPSDAGRLAQALAVSGLVPTVAFSDTQLLDFANGETFDLVVVDSSLASSKPLHMVRAVTERTDAAFVLLGTGGVPPADLAAAGVHTQLPPSSGSQEVAACAVALLGLRPRTQVEAELRWGPLELDSRRRSARWGSSSITLTPIQFKILAVLILAQGGVVSKDQLQRLVWGRAPVDDGERIVAHIRRIRAKIEADPARPRFLLTARGEGFRLSEDPPSLDLDYDGSIERRRADRRRQDRRLRP